MTQAIMTAPPAPLTAHIAAKLRGYLDNSTAESTRAIYASHWRGFVQFCEWKGVQSLPAAPQTVAAYLADQADEHRASTLSVKLAAVTFYHRAGDYPNPADSREVKATMAGIRRTLGTMPRRKKAVTLAMLRGMVQGLPDDLRGRRDRALLLTGFYGAFRRSELAAMRVEDIAITPDGKQARILVPKSKTDQEGEGRYKQLIATEDSTICPIRALREWLAAAGIQSGYIFRGLDMFTGKLQSTPLTGVHIGRIVKNAAEAIGCSPHEFGGHSLRAGFVTESVAHDVHPIDIMEQTGHATPAMIAVYARQQGAGARRALSAILAGGK